VSERRRVTIVGVVRCMDTHVLIAIVLLFGSAATFTEPARPTLSPTNIFAPVSTPAQSIFDLSLFVLMVTGAIFMVVFSLLAYAVVKFRSGRMSDGREPAQVYGSTQVELAWNVIPILTVVVLFLATARVIVGIQKAPDQATPLKSPLSDTNTGVNIDIRR
jgi:cytochrome c oxidase subunit 2